jgi:hypothetical protein
VSTFQVEDAIVLQMSYLANRADITGSEFVGDFLLI